MATKIQAEASTVIHRDLKEVFPYITDLSTMDKWVDDVSDSRLVSGKPGEVGAVYEFDYEHDNNTVPMQVEITAMDDLQRLVIESRDGPVLFKRELLFFHGDPGKTRFKNRIEREADGFLAMVLKPIVRRRITRQLETELDDLKAHLESGNVTLTSPNPAAEKESSSPS